VGERTIVEEQEVMVRFEMAAISQENGDKTNDGGPPVSGKERLDEHAGRASKTQRGR